MENYTYHTRRSRASCIGAGHTHCLICSDAVELTRDQHQLLKARSHFINCGRPFHELLKNPQAR